MNPAHYIESFRLWDIVTQWARETLQHEIVMARVLARGVVRDGLRAQSVDSRWTHQGTFELRGLPLVGYVAREGLLPIFIRATALNHLRAIVEIAATPNPQLLFDEFVTRQDFLVWLQQTGITPPLFWFDVKERSASV